MSFKEKRIFVFRNYTVESLFSGYKSVEYSSYEGIEGHSKDYDIYLWFYLCPIKNDPTILVNELTNTYNKLVLTVDNLKESKKSLIIFTMDNWAIFNYQNANSKVIDSINEYNLALRKLADEYSFVKVLDLTDFSNNYSHQELIDWKFYYISQMVINPKLAKPFQKWFEKKTNAIFSVRKKCLVLDLDNTLWGGVLGEDGLDGIKIGGTYPGSVFKDFQEMIATAAKNGVLLAACSKNNENDVLEAWTEHPEMVLRKKDFVAHRINWDDKATNINSIAKELNIGVDSIVFIDDNPAERGLVKNIIPEVSVPEFPAQPYLLRSFFKAVYSTYFQTYNLTDEDKNKTQQYHQESSRKLAATKFNSIDEYISSLNITMSVQEANKFNISRIAQMTQKTNQFNITTKRYTEDDIWRFVKGEHMVNCISVSDNFGDNGITIASIFILDQEQKCAQVDSYLLSCRILGRKIETSVFKFLLNMLYKKGIRKIKAQYIPTAKNVVCKEFYNQLGFEFLNEQEGLSYYSFELTAPFNEDNCYKIELKNEN